MAVTLEQSDRTLEIVSEGLSEEATPIHFISPRQSIQSSLPQKNQLSFYYRAIIKAIDSLQNRVYSDFDAHTTSNCCHGLAIYAREVLLRALSLDLVHYQNQAQDALLDNSISDSPVILTFPRVLIEACRLFICSLIRIEDPLCPGRNVSDSSKLQSLGNITRAFASKTSWSLQKYFSNLIAQRYSLLSCTLPSSFILHGIPINLWGNYVSSNHLRSDRKDVIYAPCLYSMQISLAFLSFHQAEIAVDNNVFSENAVPVDHFISILKGDGCGGFHLLPPQKASYWLSQAPADPIIVFGGSSFSSVRELKGLKTSFTNSLLNFPNLVLSCDAFYPQFPRVLDDPNFDNSPIRPLESELSEILNKAANISGVSAEDPSLFCLTHIYPASGRQLSRRIRGARDSLPSSPISANAQSLKLSQKA